MEPTARPCRIAPSLLSANFAQLGEDLVRVEQAGADWLHVDVMDGHFVPNLTIGPPVIRALKGVATCPLDVHIMIENPGRWAAEYVEAGAATLTFHAEATEDAGTVIDTITKAGAKAGMAINPDTPIDPVLPYLERLSLVLVMTVFPGFGGQKFMPEVLPKLTALRERGFTGDLEVDGGIAPETIQDAASAGANVFVSGTGVFGAKDWKERIAQLRLQAIEAV